jgi:hypothetical protein
MISVRATSMGIESVFLREGPEEKGRVHSVFDRVINLAFPGRAMVSVSRTGIDNSPTNIVTDLTSDSWPKLGANAGAEAVAGGKLLRLGHVIIDLGAACIWLPAIKRSLAPLLPDSEIAANVLVLQKWAKGHLKHQQGLSPLLPFFAELLAGSCPPEARQDPFLLAAAQGIADIAASVKAADFPAVRTRAQSLIGLGPGLTPSGDDLLAGLMAGMTFAQKMASPRFPRVPVEQLNQAIVSLADGRTTDISRHLLEFSARGEVSETMEVVILAILQGPEYKLKHSAARLADVGATSGADQLLGILLGISLFFDF